jgi:hypothetical protein
VGSHDGIEQRVHQELGVLGDGTDAVESHLGLPVDLLEVILELRKLSLQFLELRGLSFHGSGHLGADGFECRLV